MVRPAQMNDEPLKKRKMSKWIKIPFGFVTILFAIVGLFFVASKTLLYLDKLLLGGLHPEPAIQDGYGCPIGTGIIEGTWEPFDVNNITQIQLGQMTITADQLLFENADNLPYTRKRLSSNRPFENAPLANGAYLSVDHPDGPGKLYFVYAYPSQNKGLGYHYKLEECVLSLYECGYEKAVAMKLNNQNNPEAYCSEFSFKRKSPPMK